MSNVDVIEPMAKTRRRLPQELNILSVLIGVALVFEVLGWMVQGQSFLANPQYRKFLGDCRAAAVLLTATDAAGYVGNALVVANPYLAYAQLSHLFDRKPQALPGVHPTAVVDPGATVDPTASIGPQVCIGAGTTIGAGVPATSAEEVVAGEPLDR